MTDSAAAGHHVSVRDPMSAAFETRKRFARHLRSCVAKACAVILLLTGACGDAAEPMAESGTGDGSSSTALDASGTASEGLDDSGSGTGAESSSGEGSTTGDDECEISEIGAVVPVGDGCCGCTCGETGWSCSSDTCLRADGTAAALAPEAGFLELESYEYQSGTSRTSARVRVWYSFWPAADEPQSRPLMLLFNGGPGASTGLLFGSNTGPFTLDPQLTASVTTTDVPWTEAANLLYVDAPSTGFSYALALADGTQVPVGIDADQDASAFISVLLRFLARHPDIQYNPVILVGESYGGTRASLMLEQLLDYEALVDGVGPYQNASVHAEITRHLAGRYPGSCGRGLTRAQVASQFGHFVSVQGLVAGAAQLFARGTSNPSCTGGDPYHCDEPPDWLFGVIAEIGARLRQPDLLETVLGVDPTTIAWMHADARAGAYGRGFEEVDESSMISTFGALGSDDAYYVGYNPAVAVPQPGTRDYLADEMADVFLRAAATAEIFMTDARLDSVIKTYALAPVLEARS